MSSDGSKYLLEELEPRILLSGDGLLQSGLALVESPIDFSIAVEEYEFARQIEALEQDNIYHPEDQIPDLFEGTEQNSSPVADGQIEDNEIDQSLFRELEETLAALPLESPSDNLLELVVSELLSAESIEVAASEETSAENIKANQQINPEQVAGIKEGLEDITSLARILEGSGALGEPLPLVKDAGIGSLLGLHYILDTRLKIPVFNYFNDSLDPPTASGLVAALQAISGHVDDLDFKTVAVTESPDAQHQGQAISFDLQCSATRKGFLLLNSEAAFEEMVVSFDTEVELAFTASLMFDLSFGVDPDQGFFIEVKEFTIVVRIDGDNLKGKVSLEETSGESSESSLSVQNGTVDLDIQLSIQFDKGTADDGRISAAELRKITAETIDHFVSVIPRGTLRIELPLDDGSEKGLGDLVRPILTIHDADLFDDALEVCAVQADISQIKGPLLGIFKELSQISTEVTDSEPLNVPLSVIETSVNGLLSESPNVGLGHFFDFYTPAIEYFSLIEAFNFKVNDYASQIGNLPGIDIPDFDLKNETHQLKLKNLIEKEYNLSLSPEWDFSLFLAEIWSLLNPNFQINESLPCFQFLLGLPYVPDMDETNYLDEHRSDIKNLLGGFPSLDGLLSYIKTTRLKDRFAGFTGNLTDVPFSLTGGYDPGAQEVRIDFLVDGAKEINLAADLERLFADQISDLGISLDPALAFTSTLRVKLDFSTSVTAENAFLTMREAAVTIQVNDGIDESDGTEQDSPVSSPGVSEGRFDFDARVEFVFHGLDPPGSAKPALTDLLHASGLNNLIEYQVIGSLVPFFNSLRAVEEIQISNKLDKTAGSVPQAQLVDLSDIECENFINQETIDQNAKVESQVTSHEASKTSHDIPCRFVETLQATNGPPAETCGLFEFIAPAGDNDLTLRLNPEDPTLLELVDNQAGGVLICHPLSEITQVNIIGTDEGDDTLTVDFSIPFWLHEGFITMAVMLGSIL